MISTRHLFFVCVLVLLAQDVPQAAPETTAEEDYFSGAAASSECPQLFGDEQTREQNRKHREERLLSVRKGKYCYVVLHSTDWRDPQPIEYVGLSLVRTRVDGESDPQALVSVSGEIEELDCEPGLYMAEIDDSIGNDARILAILQNVVLIEDDRELKYLSPKDTSNPVWRMIWKSSWSMPKLPDSSKKVRYPSRRRRKHTRPSRGRRRR